jgi:hypothetical protein
MAAGDYVSISGWRAGRAEQALNVIIGAGRWSGSPRPVGDSPQPAFAAGAHG